VESQHAGEIRFVVETALHPAGAVARPLRRGSAPCRSFAHLGIWDTEHNNGVLIYVLLADRASGDPRRPRHRGRRLRRVQWDEICREMERHYRARDFGRGSSRRRASTSGASWSAIFRAFAAQGHANELPNQPVLL
jgi:uncharacterized membrane protein